MKTQRDFSEHCEKANSICKDCEVAHVCAEREPEGTSNSFDGEDFNHGDTWGSIGVNVQSN